jgi:cytochrome c oxidase subunit IV
MSDTNDSKSGDDHGHHVPPAWIFHAVFAALIVLTAVTYLASFLELGRQGNIIVALLIAIVKASLVCTFFMHLRWDKPFNTVILLVSIAFAGLFVTMSTLDTSENEWRKNSSYAEEKMATARAQKGITYHAAPMSPAESEGKKLFQTVCAACHGKNGEGVPGLGKNMPTSAYLKGIDDAGLIAFLKEGRAADHPDNTTKVAMPAYGARPDLLKSDVSDEKLEAVVAFIRTLH